MAAGGVWVFRMDGVMELRRPASASSKALVYLPANEAMRSLDALERRLGLLGWERYREDPHLVRLHRPAGGVDLITLPRDFAALRSTHMYDVVFRNRAHFKVVDATSLSQ